MKVSLPRSVDAAFNKAMQTLETVFQGKISLVNFGDDIMSMFRNIWTRLDNLESGKHNDLYSDYVVPALALGKGNSSPTMKEFKDGIFLPAFESSGLPEYGYFTLHILHDYKVNTPVTLHAHWTHNNANPSGSVVWKIDYSIAKGYRRGKFTDTLTASVTSEVGQQYSHAISDDDVITISSDELEPDCIVIGRITRDTGHTEDTFADDAFLLHFDTHYVKSQIGTTERNAPFDSAGF